MLAVRNVTITHQRDLRTLVSDVSFTLSGRDRLALIGEEGNGKSTLLKLIYDPRLIASYAAYTGQVSMKGEKPAYLPQELPAQVRQRPVYAWCGENEDFLGMPPRELHALCARMHLPQEIVYAACPASSLSGGEKVKLQLLLALCAHPTMLLLDEPSNDLDLPTLKFLEGFINTCELPVIYISHDETLLSRTATRILHMEQAYHKTTPRWTLANVPYDVYMRERAHRLEEQENRAQMERREERARRERFDRICQAVEFAQDSISRQNPSGGRLLKKKMKAVKSLEKRLDRERENMTQRPNVEYAMDASFHGDNSVPDGKVVLDFSLEALHVGERVLARNVTLHMRGPEKVLIVGENGSGKTTLLRLMTHQMLPRSDIRAAYMPQRYEEVLNENQTATAYLHTRGDKEQLTRIRTCLGAFRFTTEEMTHPISELSGGQKAKLILLRMILEDANVLLLDEPTRNLSPLSAPVMRGQITGFDGAVLCVTHDRMLIREWPGRILQLTETGLSAVDRQALGCYDEASEC